MLNLRIPATKDDLAGMIAAQVEESSTLDYKAAGALDRRRPNIRDEITKDVSAFANSAGGLIIYGLQEFTTPDTRHLPEKITPVDVSQTSREWLDQIIGQIQPRIDGVEIRPIHVGPHSTDYCFVVVIPQGHTAHQCTDLRYYRRRNFESTAMEDYEIREVMNRQRLPRPSIMMLIHHDPYHGVSGRLLLNLKNEGAVMAQHFLVTIDVPVDLGQGPVEFVQNGYQAGLIGDDLEGHFWRLSMTNRFGSPLFPQGIINLEAEFRRVKAINGPSKRMTQAIVTVYADNMPPIVFTKDIVAAAKDWI